MELNKQILSALQNFEDQFEHEFRFGNFQNNKFTPGVSKEEFDRVLGFISSFAKFKGSTFSHTTSYCQNYRKRVSFNENIGDSLLVNPLIIEGNSEDFIIKKKVKTIDLLDYGVRFSVSAEIPCNPEDIPGDEVLFKNMKRLTYQYGPFLIDFSIFNNSKTSVSTIFFDIEVELLSKTSKQETEHFISNILRAIQNQKFIVKTSEKNDVLSAYRQLVKSCFYFGCQPVPLKSKLTQEYSVSLKLDGLRKLIFVKDSKIYALDSKNRVVFIGKTILNFDNSIFDCEEYQGIYYIFDTIFHCGKDLRQDNSYHLKKRLEIVKSFATPALRHTVLQKEHHFNIKNYSKLLENSAFKNDGLIFTPTGTNYPLNSKDFKAIPLKWKKAELNTIDFLVKKKSEGTLELHVIDDNKKLIPFEVPEFPGINVLKQENSFQDGSILECMFDTDDNTFKIVKARPDKIKPNHVSVALDNFGLIVNPFDLESCSAARNETYFFDMRRFHNYIKRVLLDTYSVKNGKGGHLDLACGKGGDIFKWGDSSIRYVQGYDICNKSVTEANQRNAKFIEKPIYKNMDYNFLTKDLSKEIIQTDNVFDSASCFFAIHYFFKDEASLYNILRNTKKLKIGGHFMLSCFCSEQLEKTGNLSNSKFKIEAEGVSDSKFGRKLNVFLQDTVLNEKTTEYIVDYPYFIKTLESVGFQLVETKLFEEYYDDWAKNNNGLNSLSKQFSFLNRSFVFVKVAESNFEIPTAPVVKHFDFTDFNEEIDFCDDEGLEENMYEATLKLKKLQELKDIAKDLGINLDKKISKKSLVELLVSAKKF